MRVLVKRLFCDHKAFGENVVELEPLGVSLGWSMRPELVRRWEKDCPKCGSRVKTSGYVFNDKIARDAKDWPLDRFGKPYPMIGATPPSSNTER